MLTRRPSKEPALLHELRRCIEAGRFLDTFHSSKRQGERAITRPEILSVLRTGYHEKSKDRFDLRYSTWNYAIRGKTIDLRELRVIVALDEQGFLIITAIDLDA